MYFGKSISNRSNIIIACFLSARFLMFVYNFYVM